MRTSTRASLDVHLGLRQSHSLFCQPFDLCNTVEQDAAINACDKPAGDWIRWMLCCTSLRSRCASSSLVASSLRGGQMRYMKARCAPLLDELALALGLDLLDALDGAHCVRHQ